MILVSACLLGLSTKYDGGANTIPKLLELCSRGKFIPVCPSFLQRRFLFVIMGKIGFKSIFLKF